MNIIIFGAQGMALGAYNSIKTLYGNPDCAKKNHDVFCFIVSTATGNPVILSGVPVREISDVCSEIPRETREEYQVLICTPENIMDEIELLLEKNGFTNHKRMDSVSWAELQEKAFSQTKRFLPVSCLGNKRETVFSGIPSLQVFMAKFWKDKELKSAQELPDYFCPIQAGAANTEVRVAEVLDCTGDNISSRNGDYSELTALYWMWKHVLCDDGDCYGDREYYGLAHYRRYLMLSEDDLRRLSANDIDVVLPYPMPYEPNIEMHHLRYLSDIEWNATMQALHELQPEYAAAIKDILKQEYMYNYNIVLAKRDVLNTYCSWLFPILQRIEEIKDPENTIPPNRYIGYIGETLETLYFMYNKEKLNIVHTGCRFLT